MGAVVQINPDAEGYEVSAKFRELVYVHANDFAVKHWWLEPEPGVIDALRAIESEGPEEAQAIREIVAVLEDGDDVELTLSF